MTATYMGCRCLDEGYDECVCRFCQKCGCVGHSDRNCEEKLCTACDKWHYWGNCTLGWRSRTPPSSIDPDTMDLRPSSESDNIVLLHQSSKRRNWKDTTGIPITLQNIGPVDRASVLAYLISKVEEKMRARYLFVLRTCEVVAILEAGLNVAVKNICQDGKFDLENLIQIEQDPEDSKDAGIYLHILWRENPRIFWLYVGQASDFSIRMKNHNDAWRRHKNPSLHYHIWDSVEDIQSKFVTLATYNRPQCVEDQLILNLGEMWMCLIFQTLRSFHLDQFLPKEMQSLWSGNHLNVALPLWQGYTDNINDQKTIFNEAIGDRIAFQQYLRSVNPSVRAWAEDARNAFNDLRNSPNPILREYYRGHLQQRLDKSRKTWAEKKARRATTHLAGSVNTDLAGTKEKVEYHASHGMTVRSGNFRFYIAKKLGLHLQQDDEVILQYHVTTTQHPNAYARKALPSDPASRLGISIRGQDSEGPFHCWLTTNGDCNVLKMNTLMDVIEGVSLEESQTFKRRWFQKKIGRPGMPEHLRAHIYT